MKSAFWLAAFGILLTSTSFQAQSGQTGGSSNMEILRQKIKADKKLLVASNLSLSEAEAKSFWPVYDAYQAEIATLNDRTVKLVKAYADAYNAGPINSATAKSLLTEMLAIDDAELKLRHSYLPKFESTVPSEKVARYLQIENKIRAVIKYELAAGIPLVE